MKVKTKKKKELPKEVEPQNLKALNCFLVLCNNRKKFDKYIKINKIRNKYILDINKMMEEEDILPEEISTSNVFKMLILKKFLMAIDKKKHIYYIPSFQNQSKLSKLFNIKDLIKDTHNFSMLYFYDDYEEGKQPQEILDRIQEFDISQILKDY
jgi:hypothetical protein